MPAEALKSDRESTANMHHVLFRKICEEEQVSKDCEEGYLIKIPKKDLGKCENYVDSTLLSIPGKVFNSVADPERFGRRSDSKSTSWIPYASVVHRPNRDTMDHHRTTN
ncbi:unnamed protein product [Schistosoma mattheei]|uniref:Uncharacterized protein n=1 Tax=Schistosoma mattheei TaxID=31246 RepID=A0AA85B6D2_9TREM|nr:unnamed protein product [Schistosoma mattheei]